MRTTQYKGITVPTLTDPPNIEIVSSAFDEVDEFLNSQDAAITVAMQAADSALQVAENAQSDVVAHNTSEAAHADIRQTQADFSSALGIVQADTVQNTADIAEIKNNTLPSIESSLAEAVSGVIAPERIQSFNDITGNNMRALWISGVSSGIITNGGNISLSGGWISGIGGIGMEGGSITGVGDISMSGHLSVGASIALNNEMISGVSELIMNNGITSITNSGIQTSGNILAGNILAGNITVGNNSISNTGGISAHSLWLGNGRINMNWREDTPTGQNILFLVLTQSNQVMTVSSGVARQILGV